MTKDLVDDIMKWESGQMNDKEMITFFSKLIKSGMAWKLQGMYGRMAMGLINQGYIDNEGKINKKKLKELL